MTTTDLPESLRRTLHGVYALEREIGRGGMATVYLARDVKHERNVALKVLNPELGAVLGVERFLSEIKVTANLQHPNLLPLFDSGNASGHLYYVMPFVEGESLRARLERERQLPIDEAVRITIAVANALDYAHSHGVIHRDLKPENILMQHGQPVVADFGIALAISNAGGARVTQTGLSLGTPQYMSPEQATGDRVIDGRSDIYSLGAILYEMLTGEPPHTGGTVQATIAKVLTDPVKPLRQMRDTVPVRIELSVAKALAKLPADRFATAGAFVRALEGDATGLHVTAPSAIEPATLRSWIRHPASLILSLVALAAIAYAGLRPAAKSAPSSERTVRFALTLPERTQLITGFGHQVTISPDGRRLAFMSSGPAGAQLQIQDLDGGGQRVVQTVAGQSPAFTPDGQWIVYRNNFDLYKVQVTGGQAQELLRASGGTQRLAFYGTDSMLFSDDGLPNPHLYRTSTHGGKPERFLLNDSTAASSWQQGPVIAPDGRTVFFGAGTGLSGLGRQLGFATLDDRRLKLTSVPVYDVVGYTAGRVIYVNEAGGLMAVGFDLDRHEVVGQPMPTGETVLRDPYGSKATLNALGDLAFLDDAGTSRPVLIGGSGSEPLPPKERIFMDARYSPDGKLVAFTIRDGGRADIWIYSIASGSLDRVSGPGRFNDRVEWSPDSKRVVFRSDADGPTSMWWQPIDGSTPAQRLTPKDASFPALEGVLTPDGKTLVYRIDTQSDLRDILSVPVDGSAKPTAVLATPDDELSPRISPDGKWMAYISNESGRDEVYVRPFPGPGGRTLVSIGGGNEPLWTRDGRRIVYRAGQTVVSASVTLSPTPVVTRRETIASGSYVSLRFHPAYDIAPDGRLLMLQNTQQQMLPMIVLNWGASLAKRLGPLTR